jgi:acyl carrier protein
MIGGLMTQEEALAWVAGIFEEPVENIKPETSAENVAAWDSLGVLNLMAAFDEKFGIQLRDDEIRQMRGVKDILDVLTRHGILQSVV